MGTERNGSTGNSAASRPKLWTTSTAWRRRQTAAATCANSVARGTKPTCGGRPYGTSSAGDVLSGCATSVIE